MKKEVYCNSVRKKGCLWENEGKKYKQNKAKQNSCTLSHLFRRQASYAYTLEEDGEGTAERATSLDVGNILRNLMKE